jgi:exodeoxyribonuclease VII small subunit
MKNTPDDLETGKANLDNAIKGYERGALLKRDCETMLSQPKVKVEQVIGSDGKVSLAPLEAEPLP